MFFTLIDKTSNSFYNSLEGNGHGQHVINYWKVYLYVIYIFFHLGIFFSLAFKGPQTQNMLDHVNLHVFTHIYIFVCKCLITCTSMEKEIVYNKCKLTCLEGLRNVLTVWLMLYACEQKASKCNLAVYALHIYMLIWFNTCASNSQQHEC